MAAFFHVAINTVQQWRAKGMPGRPGRYDLSEVAAWLRAEGPWRDKRSAIEDDDLAGPADSPGLERYRLAKAKLAELELAKQQRSVMSRDLAREILGRVAAMFRRYGERLSKRHGPEEAVLFNEVLEETRRVFNQEFGGADA